MKSRQHSIQQKGFTLTEAAIVLGIMGLILGAIWVATASLYQEMSIYRSSNQLFHIVRGIRAMYSTAGFVDHDATADMYAKVGVFPSDLVFDVSTGATKNMWGGTVEIETTTYINTDDGFIISFNAVPPDSCAEFMMRNAVAGKENNLKEIFANGGSSLTSFPPSLMQAQGLCDQTLPNRVSFGYKL